jgi:hypothetical protein
MAVPGIPQNFYVQQGNGQVFLSWSIVTGATGYVVQRSIDGVNFTTVDTPVLNEYLDATVLINTAYWYQIAAANSDGTSPYTAPQKIVATLQGQLCMGELRERSQQRADRVNSNFVKLPEWNFFINQAYAELYNLLITVYEDYYVAPRLVFQTNGTQQRYELPNGQNYNGAPALFKLYGVDLGLDSSSNAWVTLKKFDFISRNRYVYPQIASTFLGVFNLQYRMLGNYIHFIPTPAGAQYIGLWYYPRINTLLKDTDVMDGISGWTEYVIVRAAKYALDKEESDTGKLDQELLFLKSQIEEGATNRDAGQPDSISATRTWSERWGGYGGPGFDGSYGGY